MGGGGLAGVLEGYWLQFRGENKLGTFSCHLQVGCDIQISLECMLKVNVKKSWNIRQNFSKTQKSNIVFFYMQENREFNKVPENLEH